MKALAAILTTLLLTLALALPVIAQINPTLSINPTSGTGGTTVSYEGTGFTPTGQVVVLISADGLIVDDTTADENGTISGSFSAPNRDEITGETGNTIPVFAIDQATGTETSRVSFTYVTGQLPGTGIPSVDYSTLVSALVILLAGGLVVRRQAAHTKRQ